MMRDIEIEALGQHDTSNFDCGNAVLNNYIKKLAGQDVRRNFSTVIVAVFPDTDNIVGYYTLSSASLRFGDLPDDMQKKIPRYPHAPAVLLGRLALSEALHGQGYGARLMIDAFCRACRNELAWAFFLVKAKDEKAAFFYKKFDFMEFKDDPATLWLPRGQIEIMIRG
ncbi:GNAT family N-acetyltransferase [Desulfosarcina sp. OttesenSCG-928-A07]|nr:GNAT family N-acetyltransferase [Desulfosarcina sp. OttesenSCG-928-G17]MDL2329320.1 GNAT family N-acetyltransferase [Desulfosarcina sp. OttesenSCG-928-A07]